MSKKRILKYQLEYSTDNSTLIPYGQIIAVGFQNLPDPKMFGFVPKPTIWVETDPDTDPRYNMHVLVVPTGGYVDTDLWTHAGTAISNSYVWHIYKNKSK